MILLQGRGKAVCTLARDYLLRFEDEGVSKQVLRTYLDPGTATLRPTTLSGVYKRLLESAQNANMRAGVIGGAIGGVGALGPLLGNFEPLEVSQKFPGGWQEVLDSIVRELAPRGEIRRTPRSIWPLYCRTILSGASFLSQFSDATDFYRWVQVFDRDHRTRPALPLLLSQEVDGLGFALSCDFFKEMGFFNFGKPDVHVKGILSGLGFIPPAASDFVAFKTIIAIAKDANLTPYYVDKVLWLVGSGRFYNHPEIGRSGRVPTKRADFVEWASDSIGARSL